MKTKSYLDLVPRSVCFGWPFALKNIGAWLCFTVVLTMLNVLMHNRDLCRELQGDLGLMFCCVLGTHILRMFILSPGENAPWRTIYINAFAIGIPLTSFMMAVMGIEMHALFIVDNEQDPQSSLVRALFGVWFFMVILLSGWTGVYISSLAVKRYNQAEVDRLETETALREAELRALKAQINPHFLFNSLNTIRALVNEHPERAQEAVLHLSLLLRAALQSERMLRPLRDEMETVGHYLELEKLRFEERLKVTIDVSPEALDVLVPTMLVQTLVENAVKHGIATVVHGGELSIYGRVANGQCTLAITNPGKLGSPATGTGLGLHNARMRLGSLIGADASLKLAEVDGAVRAELTIPFKRDDNGTPC
jgi:hypothetical protein